MEATIDDGGPAYPTNEAHGCPFPGMNLRDWFAGQALSGIVGDPGIVATADEIAALSYSQADAMIRMRKETM